MVRGLLRARIMAASGNTHGAGSGALLVSRHNAVTPPGAVSGMERRMSQSRREFLGRTGAAGVWMAASGVALSGCSTTPDRAVEGWKQAMLGTGDVRRACLSYAILAPNPHNRQPWLVRFEGADTLWLRVDRTRLLPQTDPMGRQILIGHGAFLEMLTLAALQSGHTLDVSLFPDGPPAPEALDDRPVARVRWVQGGTPDPLFAQVLRRHTAKTPFEDRPVEQAKLDALVAVASAGGVTAASAGSGDARVQRLKEVSWKAWQMEARTPRTWLESVNLTRVGRAEIEAHRDGISLSGPAMELLKVAGVMSRANMADPTSSAFSKALEKYDRMLSATRAYVWLTTAGNTREQQMETGRSFVRLQLMATQLGLVTHPPTQVTQEYPEMAGLQKEFSEVVGQPEGHKVQMLVRVGYADPADPSPRRRLDDFVEATSAASG